MKRLTALCCLMLFAALDPAAAQVGKEFIPFLATGYRYQFVKGDDKYMSKYTNTGIDTCSGWSTGNAAFGTLNNTTSPPCPLNDAAHVKTIWPSSRDLVVRKHFTLPAGTRNLKVRVALDNGVQVFINGKEEK